jgi:phosphatidylethanolamine/phosphatidyl-N-methylethanolamine N-methyltransferase
LRFAAIAPLATPANKCDSGELAGVLAKHMSRSFAAKKPKLRLDKLRLEKRIDDEVKFLSSWLQSPLKTGAVSPSSPALAKAMAREIDLSVPGPIVELGPGTGPVTEAILARGIAPSRLIAVEFNPGFCALVKKRFPGVHVVQGDGYALSDTLGEIAREPRAAIVSSLPLMTRPMSVRLRTLIGALKLLRPGAPFIQFTYAMTAPIPPRPIRYTLSASPRIWLNLPPARVWTYRAAV